MKAIVKKMVRVFDELHTTEATALEVLSGWEHKEKLTTVYVVGYENELTSDVLYSLNGLYLAKTLAEATEEANEWNS